FMIRLDVFGGAAVTASGYSIRENSERCFQHARGAKSFRRIRKYFRAAFAAHSDYSDHCPRLGVRLHLVLRKILSDLMRSHTNRDTNFTNLHKLIPRTHPINDGVMLSEAKHL